MIEIKNLYKKYGHGPKSVEALKGINLTIEDGLYGLLGPNGAGKTTLMRILAGIVQPTKGTVIVNGINIGSEKGKLELKSILGYLPQELGMYPDLTAKQFIDYIAILKGLNTASRRNERVKEVLEMVSLSEQADRKIGTFSGGMKRRVGIAQALVNDPKVLIVDEPTAGLDPEERIRFRNLLVDLADERVVLLSTHIVGDIGQTCRSMTILANGQVRYQGSPLELTSQAKGHVWQINSQDGRKPDNGLSVVSMRQMPDGVIYRVVGESAAQYPNAEEEIPSLEDGYVWLMQNK